MEEDENMDGFKEKDPSTFNTLRSPIFQWHANTLIYYHNLFIFDDPIHNRGIFYEM
jgi:hypothetical protein